MPRHPNAAKRAASLLGLEEVEKETALDKVFKRRRLGTDHDLALELSEKATHETILHWNDRAKEVSKGMIINEFIAFFGLYAADFSLDLEVPTFWDSGRDNWFHRFLNTYNVDRNALTWKMAPETVRGRMINYLATMEWCRVNLGENALVLNLDEIPTYSLMRYGKSYCAAGKQNLNTVSRKICVINVLR